MFLGRGCHEGSSVLLRNERLEDLLMDYPHGAFTIPLPPSLAAASSRMYHPKEPSTNQVVRAAKEVPYSLNQMMVSSESRRAA